MKTKLYFFILFVALTGLQKATAQENPTAREGATIVQIDTCFYLFGGIDNSAKTSNKTLLNYTTEQTIAKQDNTKVQNNKSIKALFLDSTYMFSHSSNNWENLYTSNNPPPRAHHAAASYNGKMYMFGGETANGLSNEFWEFDPATDHWKNRSVSGATISPRKNASMTIENGKIYIAGGEDENGNVLTDAYVIDEATGQIAQLSDMPGGSPTGNGAASVSLNGKIYYFGGYSEYGSSNSLLSYDPSTSTWNSGVNGFHTGFSGAVAINDMIAFVVGGSSTSKNTNSAEIYRFNAADESQTLISSNIPAGEYFNKVVFSIDTLNKSTNSIDTCLYLWTDTDFCRYQITNDILEKLDTVNNTWTLPTAVPQINNNNTTFKIYPNPAKDYIQIKGNSELKSFEIYNVNGEKLLDGKLERYELTINITSLAKGIYFVKVNTNERIITQKFVK